MTAKVSPLLLDDDEQIVPGQLYVTDAELVRLIAGPRGEQHAREFLEMVDRNPRSGFPQKNKLFGNRRSLMGVKAYFIRLEGLNVAPSIAPKGAFNDR